MKATDNKSKLVIRYHAICEISGNTKEYQYRIKKSYGVEHISDLSEETIEKIINEMNRIPDIWRKRVLAAIGGWLFLVKRERSIDIIKAIACRATQYDDFNKITVPRLRDLYSEFCRKQKVASNVEVVTGVMVYDVACKN